MEAMEVNRKERAPGSLAADGEFHMNKKRAVVEKLVEKVEKIFTTLEVTRETTHLEVSQLKERVAKLEAIVDTLQSDNRG